MTQVVILAAGKGKRMGVGLPKVLREVGGTTMIQRVVGSVLESGVTKRPVVIIGYGTEVIKKYLGTSCSYVLQAEQLGTAHAVSCAESYLTGVDNVVVINGDAPFLRPETLTKLVAAHEENQAVLTMVTLRLPDFSEWRETFYDFGRIVRNSGGEVAAIVEKKDATPEQLKITEVNPSFFCFRADWLWENLSKINCDNAQGEFYLTDLVHLAISENQKVETLVTDDPAEAVGVNTPEQLNLAQSLMEK
ncbi:NTP transferase domain-containing protein [Patescibacteria group bacterium]|nr:NTP transferase domain-containing protein [Patescibacteria group bacterium]